VANQNTCDVEKRLVDVHPTLITDAQPTELVQPTQSPFHDPAIPPQPTAMFGMATSNVRCRAHVLKGRSMRLGIIRAIRIQFFKTIPWRANFTLDRGDIIDQGQQFGDIMLVGRGGVADDGNAISVRQQMMFRAGFSTVYRAGTRFFAPPTARIVALSTAQRPKSIWSAFRRWANRIWWILRHTPAACQSRKRRQQVMPEPQPISWGSISQGMPEMRTNRMPVKQARADKGLRPGWVFRRGLTGMCGSMRLHNSSEISGLATLMSPCKRFLGQTNATTMPFC